MRALSLGMAFKAIGSTDGCAEGQVIHDKRSLRGLGHRACLDKA